MESSQPAKLEKDAEHKALDAQKVSKAWVVYMTSGVGKNPELDFLLT